MTSNWYSGSVSTLTLSLARWSRSASGQQSRPTMIQGLSRIAQPLLMNADENILDEALLDGVGIAPHRGVIREVAGAPCLGVVGDGLDHDERAGVGDVEIRHTATTRGDRKSTRLNSSH